METDAIIEKMNQGQKEQLRKAKSAGLRKDELELLANPEFSEQQLFVLRNCLESGLNLEEIKDFAKPEIDVNTMIGRRAILSWNLSEKQPQRFSKNQPQQIQTEKSTTLQGEKEVKQQQENRYKEKAKIKFRSKEENRQLQNLMKEKIKIVDIANELGFTVQRVGNSTYHTLKEHDSIRIHPNNSFVRYSRSEEEKGSVIDFMRIYGEKSLHEVLKDFTERIENDFEHYQAHPEEYEKFKSGLSNKEKETNLQIPKRSPNMHNVYAYLLKSRMIHQEVVQDLVNRKQIYQDERRNCVFVGFDRKETSKPVYIALRGTSTFSNSRFVGDAQGCDYSQGLLFGNNANHLVITEGAIDALSRMTLFHMQGKDYKNYDYLVLASGEKYESCISHLDSGQYQDVTISTDNDEEGWKTSLKIQNIIESRGYPVEVHLGVSEVGKDWNDELKYVISKGYRMDYIIPTEQQKKAVDACLENYMKDVLQDKTPRTLAGRQEYLMSKKSERLELLKHYGLSEDIDTLVEALGKELKGSNEKHPEMTDKIFDAYNRNSDGRFLGRVNTKAKKQIERE